MWTPCLVSSTSASGQVTVRVGHELIDDYLHFLSGRSRPNSVLAAGYDLKVFFAWSAKEPAEVRSKDVVNFVAAQRSPRTGAEGGAPDRRRRRSVVAHGGPAPVEPVGVLRVSAGPRRRRRHRQPGASGPGHPPGRRNNGRAAPLVRTPEAAAPDPRARRGEPLVAALRTARDRAMVEAMVLGGLRRCEVLGLRLEDLRPGQRRVFVAEGKGGHQRLIPISARFFATVAAYLDDERPAQATPTASSSC